MTDYKTLFNSVNVLLRSNFIIDYTHTHTHALTRVQHTHIPH